MEKSTGFGRPLKYILEGHTPVPCDDILQWAEWFETSADQRIVKQETVEDVCVSTVFLSLDHGRPWRPGSKPLLFETMVFRGETAIYEYSQRYATWVGAEYGHEKVKEEYLKNLKESPEG